MLNKLNLGCGNNHLPNYINVDKYGKADTHHDLEVFPWPWDSNSIIEIVLTHSLEHLGETRNTYLNVIKELYRICKDGAMIHITVPHPRHDDFITDPTHVRKITPQGLEMFSKKINKQWISNNYANTPLALNLDVDFEITNVNYLLDPYWKNFIQENNIEEQEIAIMANKYNNVIKEIKVSLIVKK